MTNIINQSYMKQEDRIKLAEMWITYKELVYKKSKLMEPIKDALDDLDKQMGNLTCSMEVGYGMKYDFIPSDGSLSRLNTEFNSLPDWHRTRLKELKVIIDKEE